MNPENTQKQRINPVHKNITEAYLKQFKSNKSFLNEFIEEIDYCTSREVYYEKKKHNLRQEIEKSTNTNFKGFFNLHARLFLTKKEIEQRKESFLDFIDRIKNK